jgi:uncharacterized protein DUF6492
MTSYTLVTVVQRADYGLLRLQARSLNRYLRLGPTDEVWVVANQGLHHDTGWQKPLLEDYGLVADRVRFLDSADVAVIPRATTGWVSQQILKLMVARIVKTDRYIVLDAKNHLVFPLAFEFFEVGNKLRSTGRNYENHPMRHFLECALRYFRIEVDLGGSSLPTITPFVFPTNIVRTLIDSICEREHETFPRSFDRLNTTEFLLFAAYLCSLPGGIEGSYDLSSRACPVIWKETAVRGCDSVKGVIARVENERLPFFTVHRHAFSSLDDSSRQAVTALWLRRHLFDSFERGLNFLINRDY